MKTINRLVNEINKKFYILERHERDQYQDHRELLRAIVQAKKEWHEARNMFNQVNHPDLIDHAIYKVEAAEKKYTYLLKEAKKLGYGNIWKELAYKENQIMQKQR